jgi:prepilin-type N-terminal cleavage/methylation domain-containing protein
MRRKLTGFTLIEVLMVVVIIAILMMMVILRVRFIGLRARESALRENLHKLRLAVTQFENDVGGYPLSLDQLILPRAEAASAIPAQDAVGNALGSEKYKGPYIVPYNRLPRDPFTDDGIFGYEPEKGRVYSQSDRAAIDSSPYSTW